MDDTARKRYIDDNTSMFSIEYAKNEDYLDDNDITYLQNVDDMVQFFQ